MSVFCYMNSHTNEKRKETLASMCNEKARMLQGQFNVSMNHLQALAILVSTFHHGKNPSAIDQMTFARYTERTAFERPLTSGVAYAVKVLHAERAQFEKQQGWTIKRMDTHEPSPIHEEYAPVIFAQDTISHVMSLDMLSGKEDCDNVMRARASRTGVLTAPFRLLKSNRLGVILTFAVYKSELPANATPDERSQATDGFLLNIKSQASFSQITVELEELLQEVQRLKPCCIRRYVPGRVCSLGHQARHSLRTYSSFGRTGDQLWVVMSICGKVLDCGQNIEVLVDKTENLRSQAVNLNIIEGLNLLKDSKILVLMPFTATQLTKY